MAERVALDPGHGSGVRRGRSTAGGTRGPRGTLEKDLTLAVARLLRQELTANGFDVSLTRDGEDNPGLGERLDRAGGARVLVSLHFNASRDPSKRGAEVWIHENAGADSHALAVAVQGTLPSAALLRGPLAVLDPQANAPGRAACLVEIDYLTNPDVERRFGSGDQRRLTANALARGIGGFLGGARPAIELAEQSSESFDIWHQVPMVPQLTGMSCWAAAAAMVVGWRDCIDVRPEEVAQGAGAWEEYRDGLEPRSVDALAATFGLVVETPRTYEVAAMRRLLERYGPLWIGAGPTGLHVVVASGMWGDGSFDGTFVRVLDPWPIGRGERYNVAFRELAGHLREATDAAGVRASILHCGEVTRGNRSRSVTVNHSYQAQAQARLGRRADTPACGPRYGTPLALFRVYQERPPSRPARPAADERDWYPADQQSFAELPRLTGVEEARYAEVSQNPDLRHLTSPARKGAFAFEASHLARLLALNHFDVDTASVVLFGLRGCRLGDARIEGTWSSAGVLDDALPDHRNFRCVLGLFRRRDGKMALYSGSTVPNRRAMNAQRTASAAADGAANLLPTGCYDFRLGDHRFVPGAFVIQPRIVVRRNGDQLTFRTGDPCVEASPADNIHPAFGDSDAAFSSAGCQTLPGWYRPAEGHGGAWARFRADALAAGAERTSLRYALLTGREARLAASSAPDAALARLRFGSTGEQVTSLQRALAGRGALRLADAEPGRFDASTALAYLDFQRQRDGGAADGIVTPDDAVRLGSR